MEYEQGAKNQPMDGNPSMCGPSESATHIARADCPHLSDPEWEALQRLATVIGEAAVATMLRTLSPTEQHGVALGFIVKEQRDAAAATTTTASSGTTPRVQSLKLHVSNYMGKEGEPLLRWLVKIDTAIAARRIFDDPSKVAFAMSCLGGRARSWAYGRRLTDSTCFSTYAEFKEELRQAIILAMQEEFSLRRAKLHANVPRMARPVMRTAGPEPMDLSNATAAGDQQRNNSSVRCFRCGYTGHYAREYTAAVHKAGADVAMPGIAAINKKNARNQ
ncbi:hypothetical protein C6341_g4322 [Phytophthora cactorum]|nr:hypothetical protein C6341_g4322 [Phytophthora cactorum]